MAVKSEKQKALEAEVKKARRSAQRRVRSLRKRGYTLPENIVPNLPKKITEATLRRMQGLDMKALYKKAVYVSPEGVSIKGFERRKEEQKETARKAAETRKRHLAETKVKAAPAPVSIAKVFFSAIEDLIWQIQYSWYDRARLWTHSTGSLSLESIKEHDADMMLNMLEKAIVEQGEEAVLKRINEKAPEIYEIIAIVLLASGDSYYQSALNGEVNNKVQEFGEIIKGSPLTASESEYFSSLGEKQAVYEVVK